MRFTSFVAVMAAGVAVAFPQGEEYEEVPSVAVDSIYADAPEQTITKTKTATDYITITKCAEGNYDCPLYPKTSEAPVIPTSEPVIIIETSSAIPTSSPYYSVSNSTGHVGPTAPSVSLPVETKEPEVTIPVITDEETDVVQPTSPPSEEPSGPAEAGAAGVFAHGSLLAGLVAVSVAALF